MPLLDAENQPTTLQKGDQVMWFKHHGTIALKRGGRHLRKDGKPSDDKFVVRPSCLLEFAEIADAIALASGNSAELESDDDKYAVYKIT